mmetsp:Transcript_119853/g.373269  ORF Transcript_119853/g.373269 Transcript_119853/m.373269 type:complete len:356 (-) Transcript_119853:25-1092(-)
MVMLLLNMLLAILMESYGQVKALAENEASLAQQIQNILRRAQQNRRGERVRLKDIWDALLRAEGQDDDAMLKSERVLFPRFLVDIVPGIPKSQALRTLTNAKDAYDALNQEPFEPKELQETLQRTERRLDNMVLCATWLSTKLNAYDDQLKASGEFPDELGMTPRSAISPTRPVLGGGVYSASERSSPLAAAPVVMAPKQQPSGVSNEEDEAALQTAIEAVRQIAQEQTAELADGVASVLGEEMQALEKRQDEQKRSMEDLRRQLVSLRRLILKLGQTCKEVGQLACSLEGSDPEVQAGGLGVDHGSAGGAAAAALEQPPPAQPQGMRRTRRRSGEDPFFNNRFSSAVGGTRDAD